MNITQLLYFIETTLDTTFAAVDNWFDIDEKLLHYRPSNGGWTIEQILEHITLTNHFLLILIDKGTSKALKNVQELDLATEVAQYVFDQDRLNQVGEYQLFEWQRPEHMEPSNVVSLASVRQTLAQQLEQCLIYLHRLPNGEGLLYKTTMTVHNLGKINVYEYIYFLAQHARRHITQMQRNQTEFSK